MFNYFTNFLTKIKNADIYFKRGIILICIIFAILGFNSELTHNNEKKHLHTELKKFSVSDSKIKDLDIESQKDYLSFLSKNKNKIISYKKLLEMINKGDYVDVSFVMIKGYVTTNYVIDCYNDNTEDYLNNDKLYDVWLDTSNLKSFVNKKIQYKNKKIITINSLEVKNGK